VGDANRRPPFPGPDLEAYRDQHLQEAPPPLEGVEPGLARLILRLLDKDPARRPQDARAVTEELQRLGTHLDDLQERLRRRALAADEELAARQAAHQEELARLSSAEALGRQAQSDLESIIQSARDFIQEALPDATFADGGGWHLGLSQARLTFLPWPWVPKMKSDDASDRLVLAGEVHATSSAGSDLGIVANVVCEERNGRLEWQLFRLRASALTRLERYRLGPYDREHGFSATSFMQERVYMVYPAMHVWQLDKAPLNEEIIARLLEEVL
jgi:hypothetical protein